MSAGSAMAPGATSAVQESAVSCHGAGMHVMFIHPNFPAQFGHIASHLVTAVGWEGTYISSIDTTHHQVPFKHGSYKVKPGEQPKVFYGVKDLHENLEHLAAVYRGLRASPHIKPDLVVGHMSFGTMLYLRSLYDCPFVGYYELLPPPFWTDQFAFRKDFPPTEQDRLFNATSHTLTYLHLHACEAAYTPTHFQLGTAPAELRSKIRVIFDGTDTDVFQRATLPRPFTFRGITIEPGTRVVTYVSRGLESIRGFDIFMKVAKRICEQRRDVIFLVAGEERTNYGHEAHHIPKGMSFKQYVLSQDEYDLSRIHFLDRIPVHELATLYSLSDLHVYLTVPYVLSWSMMQALSSGCTVLASDTTPVREVIEPGVNGLVADFYDVEALTARALEVLTDPEAYRHLGAAGRNTILERYEKKRCVDQLVAYFKEVAEHRNVTRGAAG
jgi:glycosyltransferase involved in cell wall biosynthesis